MILFHIGGFPTVSFDATTYQALSLYIHINEKDIFFSRTLLARCMSNGDSQVDLSTASNRAGSPS